MLHTVPTKTRPNYLFFLLGSILVVGILLIRGIGSMIYFSQTRNLPTEEGFIDKVYAQTVAHKLDPALASATGITLLLDKYPRYAAWNFKQASDLDPNFRDAAYGYAYAYLQDKKNRLTADDFKVLYEVIDRGEKVDPLYKPLLELKKIIAELENNQTLVSSIDARLQLITTQ
jgi:hypothetical protein